MRLERRRAVLSPIRHRVGGQLGLGLRALHGGRVGERARGKWLAASGWRGGSRFARYTLGFSSTKWVLILRFIYHRSDSNSPEIALHLHISSDIPLSNGDMRINRV